MGTVSVDIKSLMPMWHKYENYKNYMHHKKKWVVV